MTGMLRLGYSQSITRTIILYSHSHNNAASLKLISLYAPWSFVPAAAACSFAATKRTDQYIFQRTVHGFAH